MLQFLFFLQLYLNPPLGSLPETWEKYKKSIDVEKETFKCFNENKIIKLSQVNDNYIDCADGSDEPGTSVLLVGKFYCKNEGETPKIINSWSVNDGICDCCDGSDELLNTHVKCSNVCLSDRNNSSKFNMKNKKPYHIEEQEKAKNKTKLYEKTEENYINIINDDENITNEEINKIKFKYQTKNFIVFFLNCKI